MTDRRRTFERIKQSMAYANRNSRQLPSATGSYVGTGCGIAFMVGWCLLCSAFTAVFYGAAPVMAIIPALMTIVGIVGVVHMIRKTSQYSHAPTEATAAVVVSKHSRGSGEHSRNYITLEFEDGRRQEYGIGNEEAAALVGVGDEGIAFIRLDVFLAFDRVP